MATKPTRLFTAEHVVTCYHHTVPAGLKLEDVVDPNYWAHVTHQLRPHFRILCDAEDGTWTATLFVRSVGKVEVFTAVESHVEFVDKKKKPAPAVAKSSYKTKWRGPKNKWSVVLDEENGESVVEEGFDMEEQAAEWIEKHVSAAKTAA